MALPASVQYGTVKWRAVSAAADTTSDPDATPDAVPVTGTVSFTPSAPVLLVPAGAPPITVFATTVTYTLDDTGVLRDSSGRDTISLVATDSPGLTPTDWTWRVDYRLNGGVSRGSFSFRLPAGTEVDLTTVAPVSVSNGVQIIQGPKGDPGPAGSGDGGVVWLEEADGSYPDVPESARVVYFLGAADPGTPPDGTLYLHLSPGGGGGTEEPPPTSSAVRTFVGTDGAPWPAAWTTTVTGGGIADIQSNRGRLSSTGSYGAEARAYLAAEPAAADFDRTFEFALSSLVEQYHFLGVRCSGTTAQVFPNTGYGVQVAPGTANAFSVVRKHGGSPDYLSGSSLALSGFASGVPTKVRLAVTGITVSAKVWKSADPEPATWGWTGDDPFAVQFGGPTSGQVYLAAGNGAGSSASPISFISVTDNLAA